MNDTAILFFIAFTYGSIFGAAVMFLIYGRQMGKKNGGPNGDKEPCCDI